MATFSTKKAFDFRKQLSPKFSTKKSKTKAIESKSIAKAVAGRPGVDQVQLSFAVSQENAAAFKRFGGGGMLPGLSNQSGTFGTAGELVGGIFGERGGEIGGAIGDFIDLRTGGGSVATTKKSIVGQDAGECRPGTIRVFGKCIALGDAFPGGDPLVTQAGGVARVGSFGLPALEPTIVGFTSNNRGETVPIRRCNRGMVLGTDDLCYSKAILPGRSKFRKHRRAPRPPMTAADAKALARIGTLQNKVKELASDAGLTTSKAGRSTRRRKDAGPGHTHVR